MRVISWNVAGRTDGRRALRLTWQDAVASECPDVVALQEVTLDTDGKWRIALSRMGLCHMATTVDRLAEGRRYANLLATRWPLVCEPALEDTSFPEKVLSASVALPEGTLEVHVFHAPTGVGSAWGKVDALEALHRRLIRPAAGPPHRVRGLQRAAG